MSASSERASPVEKFLGAQAASGGPFALLGVRPDDCEEDRVLVALNARLDTLSRHPHRDTPEGGEVVLALHAAAAQLLDPSMRRRLIGQWTGNSEPEARRDEASVASEVLAPVPPPIAVQTLESAALAALDSGMRRLEIEAIRVLGMSGGWSPQALHRIMQIALAHGYNSNDAAVVIRSLARTSMPALPRESVSPTGAAVVMPASPSDAPRPQVAAAPPAQAPRPAPAAAAEEAHDEPPRINAARASNRALAIIFLCVSAALIAGITGVIYLVEALANGTGKPAGSVAVELPPAPDPIVALDDPIDEPLPAPTSTAHATEARATSPSDAHGAAHEMRRAASLASNSPVAALDRLEPAIDAMSAHWTSLSPEELVASQQSLIEIAYACTRSPENAQRLVAVLSRPLAESARAPDPTARQVAGSAWSSGVLTRLLGERELPQLIADLSNNALNAALGTSRPAGDTTFRHGALAMLASWRAPLSARPALAPWEAWTEVSAALDTKDQTARNQRLIGALDAVLANGPDPLGDEATTQTISLLVRSLTWRPGDESRPRLLAWFRDTRITTNDLRAVTYSLSREASAVGIDVTMVVPLGASSQVKRSIAARIAEAWGLDQAESQAALIAEWSSLARAVLTAPQPSSEPDLLSATAGVARVNAWASWIWRGHADAARADMSRDISNSAPPAPPASSGQRLFGDAAVILAAGDWAERYLDAKRNIPIRLALLDEAVNRRLTATDADLIARDAFREDRAAVRKRAQQLVAHHASDPVMVNAVLEVMPDVRPTQETSEVIEVVTSHRLPPVTAERWERSARRALVERLLELVARDGSFASIDFQAERLTFSYAQRAAATPEAAPPLEKSPPELLVGLEWTRLRAEAQRSVRPDALPLTLTGIEHARSERLRVARGVVQIFQAQQLAVLETLAYIVASENPDKQASTMELLAGIDTQRGKSPHILQQVLTVERGITQLWIMRFGESTNAANE